MENLDTLEKQIIELYGETALVKMKTFMIGDWNIANAIAALDVFESLLAFQKTPKLHFIEFKHDEATDTITEEIKIN